MSVVRRAGSGLLLIGLLAAARPAVAQSDWTTSLDQSFRRLDLDGDGRLDAAEAEPEKSWLDGADADHDGFYTLDEVHEHARNQASERKPARAPQLDPREAAGPDSPREGPQRLSPDEHLIGSFIPDVMLADLEGTPRSLRSLAAGKPTVIALVSTSCPVAKRYIPTLTRLAEQCRTKQVSLVLVAQDPTDSAADLRAALRAAGLSAPCVRDPQRALLQALGALSSTDAFVLDAASTLAYRGAIDDQYGLGYSLDAPRQRLLERALDEVLAGGRPDIPATSAPGCALDLPHTAEAGPAPTYNDRISRLLQVHCQECHRTGGAAPFPLETYEQVSAKSGMIRRMVDRRLMPPWFAASPEPGEGSPWANDRSLSERERADLFAWLDAGKPLGNPADAPLPRTYPADWQIGTPDVVLQMPEPIAVPAEGTFPWQEVDVETDCDGERWVQAIEVRPRALAVVHHVLVTMLTEGAFSESEGVLAFYAPSNGSLTYPPGFAKRLPANTKLHLQIHYTPNGTAVSDQIRIGMIFAEGPPEHEVHCAGLMNRGLTIPPDAPHYPVSAQVTLSSDRTLLSFMPHMHLRGAAFRYEVTLPDGTERTLLDLPRYDFNWQMSYLYAEPPTLPRGSVLRATGWYDNSAANPANPDPSATVRWGRNTSDEMLLGFVEYYNPGDVPQAGPPSR